MGNLRTIKKDVDFLVNEVIADCYLHLHFHAGKSDEAVEGILLEAVNLRNSLFERINSQPEKKAKQHYAAISKDLLEGVDGLFRKMSQLTK
ncbi:MAG: hypothetical protein LBK47_01785 [Prevotellaceae bacterium]|jgi:hypothetical protein|nr:hypothetical protein [Prevotellaceae bacterium]